LNSADKNALLAIYQGQISANGWIQETRENLEKSLEEIKKTHKNKA
jgi:hypothetical protein